MPLPAAHWHLHRSSSHILFLAADAARLYVSRLLKGSAVCCCGGKGWRCLNPHATNLGCWDTPAVGANLLCRPHSRLLLLLHSDLAPFHLCVLSATGRKAPRCQGAAWRGGTSAAAAARVVAAPRVDSCWRMLRVVACSCASAACNSCGATGGGGGVGGVFACVSGGLVVQGQVENGWGRWPSASLRRSDTCGWVSLCCWVLCWVLGALCCRCMQQGVMGRGWLRAAARCFPVYGAAASHEATIHLQLLHLALTAAAVALQQLLVVVLLAWRQGPWWLGGIHECSISCQGCHREGALVPRPTGSARGCQRLVLVGSLLLLLLLVEVVVGQGVGGAVGA